MIYALPFYIGGAALLIMAWKEWRRQRHMRRNEKHYKDYKNSRHE
jgi:hypothetical protein